MNTFNLRFTMKLNGFYRSNNIIIFQASKDIGIQINVLKLYFQFPTLKTNRNQDQFITNRIHSREYEGSITLSVTF